jgi:hypothetical protein
MASANDFWLNVNRLAESYETAGGNARERADSIVGDLESMPQVAREEVLRELRTLACNLPDVFTIAAARANRLAAKHNGNGAPQAAHKKAESE